MIRHHRRRRHKACLELEPLRLTASWQDRWSSRQHAVLERSS